MSTTLDDNFQVRTGKDSAVARVIFRVQFGLAEWFLRPTAGIPYIRDIFDDRQSSRAVDIIKRFVLDVGDITDAEIAVIPTTDIGDRPLHLSITLQTIYGPAVTQVEIS